MDFDLAQLRARLQGVFDSAVAEVAQPTPIVDSEATISAYLADLRQTLDRRASREVPAFEDQDVDLSESVPSVDPNNPMRDASAYESGVRLPDGGTLTTSGVQSFLSRLGPEPIASWRDQ